MPRKELPPRLAEFNGGWYVLFNEDGRSKRQSLRTSDLQEAQNRLKGWLSAREEEQIKQTILTFDACFELYFEQHVAVHSAAPKEISYVGNNLTGYFGDMEIDTIEAQDIRAYCDKRRRGWNGHQPVGNGTLLKELTIMRAVFNFMAKRVEPRALRVDSASLCHISMPARPDSRHRIVHDDELEIIQDYIKPPASPSPIPRLSLYVWLLLETGARSITLRELKWEQVDLQRQLITLNPYGRSQTNKRRPIVPISDFLLPILKRAKLESKTDYVLFHSGAIRKSFDRMREQLGLMEITAHTFRHNLASRLAMNGVSMVEIAQILGDSIKTVEKNYLHYQPNYLRGAINSLRSGSAPIVGVSDAFSEKRNSAFLGQ
jgi:integrase